MKITAITQFKNGALLDALRRAGITGSDLARAIGKWPGFVSDLLTLKKKPTDKVADAIQIELAKYGVVLDVLEAWPPEFKPLKNGAVVEQSQDIDPLLLEYADRKQLESEGRNILDDELVAKLEVAMRDLSPKLKDTIRLKYFEGLSNAEIASQTGNCGRAAIHARIERAIGLIRNSPAFRNLTGLEQDRLGGIYYQRHTAEKKKAVDLEVDKLMEKTPDL